ncbi:hypothetical protein TH53_07640 [Pedobacter lusitanus]|uniref:Contig29, whole genome shotgun sequence n=1 Tax=Pedobacter lusitanus TaxID=1503925 RepID=A0A0D0GNQ3_9SPHI|nr:hypothetical protein [Pedobacter lusitanus]KIO77785.1 hypothetical protein TH53_07640 [Pedobacter lusitanus]
MPYLYLAESYNELGMLTWLVTQMENIERPIKELDKESYLITEFQRIKLSASRDILIFGKHAEYYLNFHLCLVYGLHIRIIDILKCLGDKLYLCEREAYVYKHCTTLHVEMGGLAVFYEKLGRMKIGYENR